VRDLDAPTRRLLSHVTARLAAEYDGVFEPRAVGRVVEDSVERLGHVTVSRFVPLLVDRFARERLLASAQHAGLIAKERPQLLFVCTRNAGRSQMAAALARHVSEGRVDVRSAGSDPSATIEGAVATVMEELGIDMVFEYPKPLTDEVVRAADVVVTMGCGDACPVHPGPRYLDWHIADPAGRQIDEVRQIRHDIADHVLQLLKEILQ
jgi:arsenate reductase (thioredoxin)